MDPELEKYFNTYFALFRTDGWKQLISELNNNAGQINSVEATKDVDDMYFRKGQLNVLANIINFEAAINNGFEDASKEQEEND